MNYIRQFHDQSDDLGIDILCVIYSKLNRNINLDLKLNTNILNTYFDFKLLYSFQ